MTDSSFFLKNLWRWKCGLPEEDYNKADEPVSLEQIEKEQWSPKFIELMKNRMIMGWFRYGSIRSQNGQKYKRVEEAIRRLQRYLEEGNDELLVDVANFCMIEFEIGVNPNKHFNAVDDGEHCKSND